RNMRGLPDDFDGDAVKKHFEMRDNVTNGVSLGVDAELFGIKAPLAMSLGLFVNNYKGLGVEFGLSASYNVALRNETKETAGLNMGLSLSLSLSSTEGLGFNPHCSFA